MRIRNGSFFCWRSNVSNDNIISGYAGSEKRYDNGCGNNFWSEIGSRQVGEPGGKAPPRISRNTSLPVKHCS